MSGPGGARGRVKVRDHSGHGVRRKSIKTPSHVATISLGLYEGPLLTIIHVYRGVKTGSKSTLQHIKHGSISP